MMQSRWLFGCILLLVVFIDAVQPLCVLESDFGFKINCAFKKSGLFRVRNLGGLKAHASIGFSLGDELGFEQSLTNQDPSRRRSVSVKNGAPPNLVDTSRINGKQEKRGKQNRIMMRPMAPLVARPNQAAMDKLTSLHRRMSSTMQPIIVSGPTVEAPTTIPRATPTVTMAKPMAMGIPAFRPLPPKEEQLKVLPITAKTHAPLQIPQSKGPGLAYQSEIYSFPQSHNQISKMVSHMTATQYGQHYAQQHGQNYGHYPSKTSTPIIVEPIYSIPTTVNPFVPMPISAPPTQALAMIPAPAFKPFNSPNHPSFVDPVPHQVHDIASNYAYNTKKVDDYNTITGYSDDTTLKFSKEDINAKIAEIAKAGNISMEAVEAAIALRQQQLLNKYANVPIPTTSTTTTTSTHRPVVFEPEPEYVAPATQKPKRAPTTGKVMNAPREYYPVGYEKNFDDQFQSKVELPDTSFHCGDQKYFPGLYGDESLGCMVFHVCALTDDGLVMKSFLCPESTLFDQTILKCNWWFYVDCKNTRKLYDTNIPVSKSYQLMKALTFFSSYRKEMEDGQTANPEDVVGIKEAISILENQDNEKAETSHGTPTIQIITPQPLIDERNNHKYDFDTQPSPVYKARDLNSTRTNAQRNLNTESKAQTSDFKLITLNADMKLNSTTAESSNASSSEVRDKKHRRRMTLRHSSTTSKPTTTTPVTTTTTTIRPVEVTTPSVEIIQQEIQPIENVRQETLKDLLETEIKVDFPQNLPEIKRFYRSSAERINDNKEMTVVNNEKVQIVRPTPTARLVGQYATQVATIAKLDEAVLGKTRSKKEVVTIVTPHRYTRPIEKT